MKAMETVLRRMREEKQFMRDEERDLFIHKLSKRKCFDRLIYTYIIKKRVF